MSALTLTALRVRRTPGILDGFVLDGLVPGVNVVHGPNGSGKTSTARAMEAVIWGGAREGALSVLADYRFGEQQFQVDLESGRVMVRRDGAQAEAPVRPAEEWRARYRLPLHELLAASDEPDVFAAEIDRQSVGGYDLDAAAGALGFRDRPSLGAAELRQLETTRQQRDAAQRKQAALHEQARELDALEARAAAAASARARGQVLERALRHARARDAHRAAEQRLAELPAILGQLRGDEYERMEALGHALNARAAEEQEQRARVIAAARDVASLFPHGAPAASDVAALRHDLAMATEGERDRASQSQRVAAADVQLAAARRTLGAHATDERLLGIDASGVAELAVLAREAEQLGARVAAADAEVGRGGAATQGEDLEALRAGIAALAKWMKEGATASGEPAGRGGVTWLLGALGALGVVAWALLALRVHPAAWLGALVALVLVVLATRRATAVPDARATRERDYAALGLAAPRAWEAEAVVERLDELERRLAAGAVARERAGWREDAARRRAELAASRADLARRALAAAERLGAAPDVDAPQLAWLADRIARWQDARAERDAAVAAEAASRAEVAAALARIATRLAPLGMPAPADVAATGGAIEQLEHRIAEHDAARARQAAAEEAAGVALRAKLTVQKDIVALFARAGIDGPDFGALQSLCARHGEYTDALEELGAARRELGAARDALAGSTGVEAALLECAAAELESSHEEAERAAGEYGDLLVRAASLRTSVDAAKRGSDVEVALAEVAMAEDALRLARARDLRAMVGALLVRHVQRRTRDADRPRVFERARELLAQFTRGRYRLQFSDRGGSSAPAFTALDERTQVSHTLDELSSATRVQLLLAVRVAFVETQEQGVRLPLFLDETLGTCDDGRAQAIIDAVIALADEGRQVFYFTAQRDEVAKWTASLAEHGATGRVIDLGGARHIEDAPAAGLPVTPLPDGLLASLPAPGAHTHESYAAALGVRGVRPAVGTVAATPLWYLVDDVAALHEALAFLGRDATWGMLQNMVEHGGAPLVARHQRAFARAACLARVIEVMHQQAAVGRGRTVDRAVLTASGAVTRTRVDEVLAAAARCGGRAGPLLDALERREVAGFGAKKVDELRAYLTREAYLDDEPPRTSDEVRAAMVGAAMEDVGAGRLDRGDVDALLRRIERGGAASSGTPSG